MNLPTKDLNNYLTLRSAAIVAVFAMLVSTLVAQRPRILVVNGKNVGAAVLQSRGRTYVDVETVAQAMNGSVTLQPDRVVLTLPGAKAGGVPEGDVPEGDATASDVNAGITTAGGANAGDESPLPPETISREFASSALSAVALMRDWRVSIELLKSLQLPITGATYFQDSKDRAEQGLQQAGVLASTDPDHQAYLLLQNEYTLLALWAGNAIATRQALDATRTMGPDVLKNDAELQKISACGNGLGAMLASLHFADIPGCH